ncbi:hypothetical protein [Janibacter melonis]|uniref:hypothetical protein n=1 Tax=Janibacter melonis TaxID=262209 RepID=UPI00209598AC|nr:hypothetical protein [Janibacter melonis]
MSTSQDHDLVAALVNSREESVGRSGPDLDAVVCGGRRTVRHRRVGALACGAAAMLAVAGVWAAAGIDSSRQAVEPAAPSPVTFAGCTLEPTTCDAAPVEDGLLDKLTGVSYEPDAFVRGREEDLRELTDGARAVMYPLMAADQEYQLGSIDVVVATRLDEPGVVDAVLTNPRAARTDRRAVEIPGAGGLTATVVTTADVDDEWFQIWVVPEGDGHGAVAISYEGRPPEGASPALGVTTPTETPGGWSDDLVAGVIADLLLG